LFRKGRLFLYAKKTKGSERLKFIRADLPRTLKSAEIHILADLHIGDPLCDRKLIKQRVDYIKNTESAYCILNGDICNWATRNSVSDIYSEQMSPMQQIKEFVDLFSPIKDKILSIQPGNHENRSYRSDGIDITELACRELGIADKYSQTASLVFIRLGENSRGRKESIGTGKLRRVCYVLYVLHGSGGGRKEGSKANRLAEMASVVDADIYIHSHTHLPMIMRQAFYRLDLPNSCAAPVDKLFVNTSATLWYGGYGEQYEYKPNSKATPVIYLDGTRKEFTARL
jgi:predicted phosphodiesterase